MVVAVMVVIKQVDIHGNEAGRSFEPCALGPTEVEGES